MSWVEVKNGIGRLSMDHWAWVHAKVALIVCGIFYYAKTPPAHERELGTFLNEIVAAFTSFGAIMSVVGLIISTSHRTDTRQRGLSIELAGLMLAACGPITYFVTSMALARYDDTSFTRAAFAYALASFVVARTFVVLKAYKRGRYNG